MAPSTQDSIQILYKQTNTFGVQLLYRRYGIVDAFLHTKTFNVQQIINVQLKPSEQFKRNVDKIYDIFQIRNNMHVLHSKFTGVEENNLYSFKKK